MQIIAHAILKDHMVAVVSLTEGNYTTAIYVFAGEKLDQRAALDMLDWEATSEYYPTTSLALALKRMADEVQLIATLE